MSNWGLVELGSLNPNLQRLTIYSESMDISGNGVRMLKKELHRISDRNLMLKIGPVPITPPPSELMDLARDM